MEKINGNKMKQIMFLCWLLILLTLCSKNFIIFCIMLNYIINPINLEKAT